jgi:hypothetical protein
MFCVQLPPLLGQTYIEIVDDSILFRMFCVQLPPLLGQTYTEIVDDYILLRMRTTEELLERKSNGSGLEN